MAPEEVGSSPHQSEQTFAELDHQELVDGYAVAAQARVVGAALPGAEIMLIARRGSAIRAARLRDGTLTTDEALPSEALRAVLAAIPDDDAIDVALARLGVRGELDHAVACDPDGQPIAFAMACYVDDPLPHERTRATLARAAAAIGGWMCPPPSTPAHRLLESVDEPALLHEDGVVLVVNQACATLLGRAADDLVGTALARLIVGLPRFPLFIADVTVHAASGPTRFQARERTLVVGGHVRRVLVLRGSEQLRLHRGPAARAVANACIRVAAVVRRAGRLHVGVVPGAMLAAPPDEVVDLLSLALLDAATTLDDRDALLNRIRIATVVRPAEVVFEIAAHGELVSLRYPAEHLGASACASQAALLGGRVEVDASETHTRTIRVVLPRELP